MMIFLQLGDYEIAWIDAEVGKTDGMLSLQPLSGPASPHKSVLVGDLKLADFKQFLASKGIQVLSFFLCSDPFSWLLFRLFGVVAHFSSCVLTVFTYFSG